MSQTPELESLLVTHRETLRRMVAHRGRGLLRFESSEDLVQGVHIQALQVVDHFDYRGEREFLAWIGKLANQHIARRNEYWKAKKRHATRMLRITSMGRETGAGGGGVDPVAAQTGASTFAERREQLVIATQAVSILMPRDQQIVRCISSGQTIHEIAAELEISYDAAERARLRAIERFRKACELVASGREG